MAKHLLIALSATQIATACQRDLYVPDFTDLPHDKPLVPRQAATFPPLWTANEAILHNPFSAASIDKWSSYYTHGDHIAGRNRSMAEETARRWTANGVLSSLVEYEVFLSFPNEQRPTLKWGNGSVYEAQLFEDVLEEDETTGLEGSRGLPGFHGYSASGKVEAEYVYVG